MRYSFRSQYHTWYLLRSQYLTWYPFRSQYHTGYPFRSQYHTWYLFRSQYLTWYLFRSQYLTWYLFRSQHLTWYPFWSQYLTRTCSGVSTTRGTRSRAAIDPVMNHKKIGGGHLTSPDPLGRRLSLCRPNRACISLWKCLCSVRSVMSLYAIRT